MSAPTTDPMIGRLVDGRYQVRSRIARGGMATVYLATDLRLERRVAIKVMHGHLADDSQFKQRFIQEARSAARLAHPNVVNVFDQGQDADSAYLVMEYLPGITLRDLLEEYGALTPQQTIDITEAVLNGLAAAHKAGIIHRDLKPENVLLADDGRIKIGDFGLARAATANTATGAQLLGTIAYLSPELLTRGLADTRSDIYAVGIMMYEMLTGEQPFKGEQPMQIAFQHANRAVPPPSAKNPKVPPELDEIVLWATDRDPERRPADARVLLEQVRDAEAALATALEGTGPLAAQRTVVLPPAPATTRRMPAHATERSTGPARPHADDATEVLGARGGGLVRAPLVAPEPGARPRRARRWLWIAVVAAIALLGAGVGWWFLWGPGARVTIPDTIAGLTAEEAREVLTGLGLEVAEETGEIDSPTIEVGLVADTDPPIGTSAEKGSVVTLLLSTGPRPYEIAFARGMPRAEAEAMVAEHFTLAGIEERFDAEVAAGGLIDALGADDESLIGVETYGDQQPIRLIVSVGPLPDLAGKTLEEAAAILADHRLQAQAGAEVFHNSIPAQRVVGIQTTSPTGDPLIIRPGDTVLLTISKGPDLVEIPGDIEDLTLAEAKSVLEGLGFKVEVETNIPQAFWGFAASEVDEAIPGPGEFAIRGSTVKLRAFA